ncbi:LRR domain containing protein [Parasponia andersonii]|uniref:LRR domain containing protein n=1 Tax=Parasponia andersonii TaxID=3476 RepID=A0A2P5ATA4_PARAD|nr:LRR domain containing protein [Parasponia andersonii]
MVHALLEDAKDQRETNTTVRIWLSKLEYVAFDVEYLLADFTMPHSPSSLHYCSKVVKKLHTLEMTIDEGLRLNLKERRKAQREWNKRETSSFIVESKIRGREEEKEEKVRLLLSTQGEELESLEISDCNSLLSLPDIEIGCLSNIRTLSIENCNNLSSLTMGFQYLTTLENLTIMYCPSLGLLPEGIVKMSRFLPEGVKCLAALQHLSIQDCPQLLERCTEHRGEDWPKIVHVPYKRIGLSQQSDPSAGSSSSSI